MLNKVLKKMQADEPKQQSDEHQHDYVQHNNAPKNSGFHSKGNSQLGADRQRSMGNLNRKPSK